MDFFIPSGTSKGNEKGNLKWWQLSLVGVGCTIGTGFFLGSAIGIETTGPSIVFSFLLATIGTYIVYDLLAKMTAADPQEGSFCYYANKAYGRWASFSCGWNYWSSNILIMGSQLMALSILTRFWFEHIPLWILAAGYSILSIIVVLTGTSGFDKIENLLAIIKTAAIIMFIIIASFAIFGWMPKDVHHPGIPTTTHRLFPEGIRGFWASLIYAYYAFGGIEVIGLMAMRLKKKEDAPKAGMIMLIVLAIIYILALLLAVTMDYYGAFSEKESPFVTALEKYHLSFFPHVFNAAIIIAGFSTMTASLFGVTTLLVTLAKDGDAPALFSKKVKKWKSLPLPSLLLATIGLLASIIAALVLPGKIYEYITTAASILLLFNWGFIIISALRILTMSLLGRLLALFGVALIVAAISGTLVERTIRFGLFISLLFAAIISIVAFILQKTVWKKTKKNKACS
ncbi:amino acid permease [Bacillus ginsengihumi]|uniref:Amino acid permease n=1 Tax=Heyndrickxia ginsengihumi TaxID=363870 RepID=A0A6M0P2B8_9BACI|nr:amino acid permease [Heyndrickxia ginsengihumi]MCM3024575.1 amino acid permease [Heyndrickxia ginsengihumi]NEY18784.1 amino acid permease [Heyndrickxia ginsengihumi]